MHNTLLRFTPRYHRHFSNKYRPCQLLNRDFIRVFAFRKPFCGDSQLGIPVVLLSTGLARVLPTPKASG